MHLASVFGFVSAILVSGCAGPGILPSNTPPASSLPQGGAEAVATVDTPATLADPPPPTIAPRPGIATAEPVTGPSAPPKVASTVEATGKTPPPVVKAPAKPAAVPAPAAQPQKPASTPLGDAKPRAPPLDLSSLEQRLKDTNAIGLLTKITLKNQVNDLLTQFRNFYQGRLKVSLAELRRSYDLLVLKVLSLIQDSDQGLATAIVASREAIWGILSDPEKFAKI